MHKRNPFKWWSRHMQPGRLKWPLWSIFIGKISTTSQQTVTVEIPSKVKCTSCSSGHTASPCVWCFQVVVGVLKRLWQLCLVISWDGGTFLRCGCSSSCLYYKNNTTLKYQPVAIALFSYCSTGVRKARCFWIHGNWIWLQCTGTIYLQFVTYALLCLHIYWQN